MTIVNTDANGDVTGTTESETNVATDGSSTTTTTNYNADGDPTSGSNNTNDVQGNSSTQNIEYDEQGNETVTSVVIPDSVTTIGTRAFAQCVNLIDVDIPDSQSDHFPTA